MKAGKASPYLNGFYLSNPGRHSWTTEHEEELIKSAAHAIAGSLFLKHIPGE